MCLCCCYFQANSCLFKWSSVDVFIFPDSFQGPLKPNRPILQNSVWKLQLRGKLKIKLTFHKEFRTSPGSSHPKENQLRWFFLLIFDSHHMHVAFTLHEFSWSPFFFSSLAGSQLSFPLVLSTQLQKWYQMYKPDSGFITLSRCQIYGGKRDRIRAGNASMTTMWISSHACLMSPKP